MMKKLLKKVETLNGEQVTALYTMLLILTDDEERFTEGLVKKPEPPKKEPTEPEVPRYERNTTMRLLGKQFSPMDSTAQGKINDVVEAYDLAAWFRKDTYNIFSYSIDLFNLGVIEGKRKERQNKKATAKPTK